MSVLKVEPFWTRIALTTPPGRRKDKPAVLDINLEARAMAMAVMDIAILPAGIWTLGSSWGGDSEPVGAVKVAGAVSNLKVVVFAIACALPARPVWPGLLCHTAPNNPLRDADQIPAGY